MFCEMRSIVLIVLLAASARAAFTLKANFGDGQELPSDHRGDEDNVSPPISWSGQPKNTESFVLVVDSSMAATEVGNALKTHWLVYDIPKDVTELREELSGAGASSVSRLGMKEDAGQAPVVRAWRSHTRAHRSCCPDCIEPPERTDPCRLLAHCAWLNLNGSICRLLTRWAPSTAGWIQR